jgi:hypothetical protein
MSEAKIWLCRLHWIYTYENNSRIIAKSLCFFQIIMELPIWTIKSILHLKQKDWQRVISDFFSTYSLASTTLWCTACRLPAVITTRTRFSWASSCSWAPSSFHTTWRSLELRLVWIFNLPVCESGFVSSIFSLLQNFKSYCTYYKSHNSWLWMSVSMKLNVFEGFLRIYFSLKLVIVKGMA